MRWAVFHTYQPTIDQDDAKRKRDQIQAPQKHNATLFSSQPIPDYGIEIGAPTTDAANITGGSRYRITSSRVVGWQESRAGVKRAFIILRSPLVSVNFAEILWRIKFTQNTHWTTWSGCVVDPRQHILHTGCPPYRILCFCLLLFLSGTQSYFHPFPIYSLRDII